MSDSIKKWHEMQEDKKIFESPDGGKTVTERPFGADVSERKTIVHPQTELKKEAYRLLCEYDEEVIRMAMKIIDIGV
jgi:hypothetical protein